MHDIQPSSSEFEFESDSPYRESEYEDTFEYPPDAALEQPFDEAQEMELAAELLEVADDAELGQFLGSLMRRAAQAAGALLKSPTGRALGGILKGAAKKALPQLGRAIGGYFGGSPGSDIGARLASQAGHLFGLELEGLSPEDQEFELARRYVRFAGNAAQRAAAMRSASPVDAARHAAVAAARHHAPGLIARATPHSSYQGAPTQGRWLRRGRTIILVGA